MKNTAAPVLAHNSHRHRAVAFMLLLALVGSGCDRGSSSSAVGSPGTNDSNISAEFCRRAIESRNNHDDEQADELLLSAGNAAIRNPAQIPAFWRVVQTAIKDYPLSRKLASLNSFQSVIQASLETSCNQPSEFDLLWTTRKEVRKERDATILELRKKIQDDVERFQNQMNDKPFDDFIAELDKQAWLPEDLSPLSDAALKAAVSAAPDEGIAKLVGDIIERAKKEEIHLEQELKLQCNIDQKPEADSPTDDENAPGKYAALLKQIAAFGGKLKSANTIFAAALNDAAVKELQLVQDKIGVLATKVQEAQVTRYNLWAVQQIDGSDAGDWTVYLGRIDVRFLHPIVSALYSMTYENRMQSTKDPKDRPELAARLLRVEKVRIDRF